MMKLEWNLWFSSDLVATVKVTDQEQLVVDCSSILTIEQHAAVACVTEVARCLLAGKEINRYFNPTVDHEAEDVTVRCQWQRSGKLWMSGETTKRYMHASTVEEAMKRRRVFTCPKKVYESCPKRRQKQRIIIPS